MSARPNRSPSFQVAGFRVVLAPSALVVLALVAWSLGAQVLPRSFPGAAAGAYWAAALLVAALFLAGLLAHEFAHALVARRFGRQVEEITLWLFGGVARIGGGLPSPPPQLLVAAPRPAAPAP